MKNLLINEAVTHTQIHYIFLILSSQCQLKVTNHENIAFAKSEQDGKITEIIGRKRDSLPAFRSRIT